MTHSTLFFSYLREDFHRRLWTFVLSFYLCLTGVLDYALSLHGSRLFWGSSCLGPENPGWFLISGFLAVLCAFQGFSYFLAETPCDFYLSLPLNRTQLFLAGYLNGCVIGLFPCVLGRLTCLFVEGSLKGEALYYTAVGILISTVGFFLLYHTALFVLFLAGRMSAALIGILLLFAYGPITFGFIFQTYGARFFETWYQEDWIEALSVDASPFTLLSSLSGSSHAGSYDTWKFAEHRTAFLLSVFLLFFFLALSVYLSRKRCAEACGKILVFAKAEFPVKLFLTVPAALLCGCYIMRASLDGRSLFWLFLGITGSAFTFQGLLECFFRFDIHAFFHKKRQTLCLLVFALLIAANYYFDWHGYDDFLPKPQNLTAISVSPSGLDDDDWQTLADTPAGLPLSAACKERLASAQFTGKTKESAWKWIQTLREQNEQILLSKDGVAPIAYTAVAYFLENGRTCYRKYPLYQTRQLEEFASVYDTNDYKEAYLPLFSCSSVGRRHFVWSNGSDSWHLSLNEDENQALLAAYQRDAQKLSLSDLKKSFPVGTLSLSDGNYSGSDSVFLYPEFTETLDLLEAANLPARDTLAEDYEILSLLLYEVQASSDIRQTQRKKVLRQDIRDPKIIRQLQPWLLCADFAVNPILHPVEEQFEITVLYRDTDGATFRYLPALLTKGSPVETILDK